MIKSRRLRWAGHVACMGKGDTHTGFWWENLRERENLEDPGVGERIILKQSLEKREGGHGLDRSVSGQGQVAGFCESGNESSGSIKCGDSAPRNLSVSPATVYAETTSACFFTLLIQVLQCLRLIA